VQAAKVGESRHLGFDRTGNNAIRSADPEGATENARVENAGVA